MLCPHFSVKLFVLYGILIFTTTSTAATRIKCTFGWCGKEDCPDSPSAAELIINSEVESVRPGKNWIVAAESSLWPLRSGKWEEIQLCPQFFMVHENSMEFTLIRDSSIVSVQRFSMTCCQFPKSKTDGNHVEIPISESFTSDSGQIQEKKLHVGDTGFTLPYVNIVMSYQVAPYANGFEMPNAKTYSLHLLKLTYHVNYNESRNNMGSSHCPKSKLEPGEGNQCPSTFRICGVTSMSTVNSNGLAALAFKCCPFCAPEEKWIVVHNVINPSSETYKDFDPTKIHQTSYNNNSNHHHHIHETDSLTLSILERFSSIIGKSEETRFNWSAFKKDVSNNNANNNNNNNYGNELQLQSKKFPVSMPNWKEGERNPKNPDYFCPSRQKCVYTKDLWGFVEITRSKRIILFEILSQ